MQRLNTVLTQLCIEARANQTEADAQQHNERMQQMIDRAASAPLTPAPTHLHDAGNVTLREVTAADIDNLRIGRSIALATRALLKKGAGNQRLAIAAGGGDSQMATRGMRKLRLGNTLDADANPDEAALAILAGAGLCGEHARVASALARQQNIAVVRVGVEDVDHGVALLLPQRGSKAIVVDAWTTIPSSCLKADSLFADVDVAAISPSAPASTSTSTSASESESMQESPVSSLFNLVTLDTLRERLSQQLGPDPIKHAMQDDFRAKRNAAYDGGPRPRWVSALPDAIYHEAANYLSDEARRRVTIHTIDADGVAQHAAQPGALIDAASFTELRTTAIINSTPLHNWMYYQAQKRAVQVPQHPVTLQRVHTDWLTASNGVRACVSVDLEITRRPFLRDMRLPSKNILYRSVSGETFATIDTEQSVIDTGLRGLDRAQQAGFPERFVAAVKPSLAITAALAEYALKRLQTRQTPASTFVFNAATHTDLQLLDEALTHLPQAAFDIAMQRFSALLPELHSTQITEGVRLWKTHWTRLSEGAPRMTAAAHVMDGWARRFDDTAVEPPLRDALLLTYDPARLIDALARHVLIQPSMQQRALDAIDAALVDLSAGDARDALLKMIREGVIRIADAGTRAAGLAMVARHA